MRRAVLTAMVVLLTLTPGCLDDTIDRFWDDLEARDEYTRTSLLDTSQPFAASETADPMNPPGGPDDAGANWTTTFEVPQGSTALTVVFKVQFTTPSEDDLPPTPVPPPASTPRGQVELFVRGPSEETQEQNASLDRSGAIGLDFRNPEAGQWEVGFHALGEGEVSVTANGRIPIGPR